MFGLVKRNKISLKYHISKSCSKKSMKKYFSDFYRMLLKLILKIATSGLSCQIIRTPRQRVTAKRCLTSSSTGRLRRTRAPSCCPTTVWATWRPPESEGSSKSLQLLNIKEPSVGLDSGKKTTPTVTFL